MRKIEKDMLQAIKDRRNWQSGNTRVSAEHGPDGTVCRVWLHGNLIAVVGKTGTAYHARTVSKWPTATTRSRLRALGIDATIRNGIMHINGLAV